MAKDTKFDRSGILIGVMRLRGRPGPQATAMAMAANSQGARVVFFLPEGVDLKNRRINGKWFNATKWEDTNCRFPDVIENDEACTGKKHVNIWRELTKTAPHTTHRFGGKLEVFKRIKKNAFFKPFIIPERIPLSDNDIDLALERFGDIILKPALGAKGGRIWKVCKRASGIELRSSEFRGLRKIRSTAGLLHEVSNGNQFLIQKYVASELPTGNAFDIRIHSRRNGEGRWELVKTYARIGSPDSITSNISAGGSIGDTKPFLIAGFGDDGAKINEHLRSIAKNAPAEFQKLYPEFTIDALGIDLGIDKEGKPWLFEVNSFPGAKFFETTDAIPRIAYCLHLYRVKAH